MRMGTRGLLTTTWPSPASVGARMADRMPASQIDSPGNTSRATMPPRSMVSSIPVLSQRPGSVPILRNTVRSVWLASVNSSSTNPNSASRRNTVAVMPAAAICIQAGDEFLRWRGCGRDRGRERR
jgi:hypothetical protein